MTDLVLELEILYLPSCGEFSVGTFKHFSKSLQPTLLSRVANGL